LRLTKGVAFVIIERRKKMIRNIKKATVLLATVLLVLMPLAATAMVAGGSDSVTGVVEQSDTNIYITTTDDGSYLVVGYDLSGMVGQTVTATGTVTESGGKTIEVTAVEILQ
jgi:hypothetical protein